MDVYFRRLQLVSAAFFSYSHGANDAMKTMGIITGVLFTARYLPEFRVPIWVIFAAHAAIGLGTMSGGWRIIRTMGARLTQAEAARRLLRRNRRRRFHPAGHLDRPAGVDDARDRRRDCRCRLGAAGQGGPLGFGDQHRLGLGAYDSGVGARRLDHVRSDTDFCAGRVRKSKSKGKRQKCGNRKVIAWPLLWATAFLQLPITDLIFSAS